MNSKKVFFGMLGLVVLLSAAAAGLLVLGDQLLSKESKKLVELRLEEHLLDQQQASLLKAQKDIEEYADLEKTVQAVVPQDKDQARAVREIIRIAGESGIKISSIDFPSSSLGAKPSKSSGNQNPDAPGGSSAPKKKEAPVSQAEKVDGIDGVYSLQMNIVPDASRPVSYYKFLEFLSKLENNRRTAQVTSVKIEPVGDSSINPAVTFSLTINIFVKPS